MDYGDYEAWLEARLAETQAKIREIQGQLDEVISRREKFQTQLDGVRAWRVNKPDSPSGDAGDRAESQTHHEKPARGNGARKHGAAKKTRVSKNQPIFDAFTTAGPAGLTLQEVREVAMANGLVTDPGAIRALCWSAKQDGRLIALVPGRYAIAPKDEAAVTNPTKEETAASAAHDRHREGDAGGGT